jgi:arylsulfatase A-like enzyme
MADSTADTASSPAIGARDALRLSLWFGLVTGIGSACLIGIQKFILDDVTLSSPQMVWTAPLMLILLFLPIGALLFGLVHVVTPRHRRRALVFLLALVSCGIGLMIWGKQLADAAVAILSLGVAAQLSHLAAHRPTAFRRLVRVTSIAGVAVVLLAAGVVNVGGPLRERYRVARLPQAHAGSPNVLIIILDTVRALSLGLYGYERPTSPNLERMARLGTVFDHAIAPAPWTLPSHASMFTGVPAHELSAGWTERLDGAPTTLAESFRDRGYRTGGVVANWFYTNSEWGIDRGFLHYSDFTHSFGHALASTSLSNKALKWMERRWQNHFWFHRLGGRRIAPDISRDLIRWLERDRDRPFFAFVNYYDAHDPYVAPAAFVERIRAMPRRRAPPVRALKDGRVHDALPEQRTIALRQIDLYDAAIAYLDDEIGKLLGRLDARGRLDNTIVVITSDHGEEFGENGHYWHGQSLYNAAVHVPLLIVYPPTVPAGRRVARPVSLTDLAATITDLANVGPVTFPGASLARHWNGSGGAGERVFASLRLRTPRARTNEAELRAVFSDDLHYIASDVGREWLFRYRSDPLESNNLVGADSLYASALRGFRWALEAAGVWKQSPHFLAQQKVGRAQRPERTPAAAPTRPR